MNRVLVLATAFVLATMATPTALAEQGAEQVVIDCFSVIVRPIPEPVPSPDPIPIPRDGLRTVLIMAEGSNLTNATIRVDGRPLTTVRTANGTLVAAEAQLPTGHARTVTIGAGSQEIDFSVVLEDAGVVDLLEVLECFLLHALPAAETSEFAQAGFYNWVVDHTEEVLRDLQEGELLPAENHAAQIAERFARESDRKVTASFAIVGESAYRAIAEAVVGIRQDVRITIPTLEPLNHPVADTESLQDLIDRDQEGRPEPEQPR